MTLRRIAKGFTFDEHVEAASLAHEAGMTMSAIFLLGAGGSDGSAEHAIGTAGLATAMNPESLPALRLTVVKGTPIATLEARGRFTLPPVETMLGELRTIVAEAKTTIAEFRTNRSSNYLPLAGVLPGDRDRNVVVLDDALAGRIALRPESTRRL